MSFGKINKIMKFIDKFIINNGLEKISQENYNETIQKIIREWKDIIPEISYSLICDILGKKYNAKYS